MPTLKELRDKRQKLEEELKFVDAAINQKLSYMIVRCENIDCLRGYEIRELAYKEVHTFEEECGYGGSGRYWINGHWICPQCQHKNDVKKKSEVEELKHLFAFVEVIKK